MQGSYLPVEQRAKLSLQGRKSHFALGKTDGGFATTQNSFFKSFIPTSSPQTNTRNRTASHFNFGEDNSHKYSEFTSNYRTYSVDPRKPRPKIVDLTPSSVVVGMQKIQFFTSNSTYKTPAPQAAQSYSNSPAKNRKHNFDLGNDSPVKSSLMHSDYSPVKPEKTSKVDKGILNSHIVMGGHPSMYKTVASYEYSRKNGSPGALDPYKTLDLKKEHFLLGNDQPSLISNQHDSYKPLINPKQGLTKEALENLKSSHFSFKAENPDYVSVSKQLMTYTPAQIPEQEKYLKVNHVTFGDDIRNFSSNYTEFHNYRSQSVNKPVRTKVQEMNSNLVLGTTNPGLSITSSIFNGEKGVPGRLDKELEKNLRGHHYSLGNSSNIYEQSHKNYGTGQPNPSKFQEALKKEMNSTHWTTGYHKEGLNTDTQRTYKPKNAEKRNIEDYLRKHNHSLGDSLSSWKSSYNGNFQWIQPIPDTSAKFSFD
jgi:hypothetical protein